MEQTSKKESKDTLLNAIGGFISRSIREIALVLIKVSVQGLVLAYPLKWLWNDLVIKTNLQGVKLLTYWSALEILVLFLFITKLIVVRKAENKKVEEIY